VATKKQDESADAGSFTNQPDYDPAGKGLDYGGDGEGTGNVAELQKAAEDKGYFGKAPGDQIDGDLSVGGVANRDVVKDQAEAKAEAAPDGGS